MFAGFDYSETGENVTEGKSPCELHRRPSEDSGLEIDEKEGTDHYTRITCLENGNVTINKRYLRNASLTQYHKPHGRDYQI